MIPEGQQLGEFEILSRIGQGGMGAVYKARQTSLDRFVALKTLQDNFASDPEFIARFRREAKAAASLIHPNLVQVFSAGETGGLHWFAMEFVEGESAQSRLKRKGRLELAEAIAIATHIATALEYGWRKAQLIHRDIKPDNIFLSNDGEVKLGDLGLAKSVGSGSGETISLTMTGSSMGTPHYISPEQGQGKKDVDFRADIYSLGCTLYHLVSGTPPYAGDTALAVMMQHVTAPVPNLGHALPGCPQSLAIAVMKMMAKDPAHRPQSYAEVLAGLRRAYDEITGASVPPGVAAPTAPPQKQPPPARPAARKAVMQKAAAAPAADIHSTPTVITHLPGAVSNQQPAPGARKSKTPLIAALVLALAVIGIVVFAATRKKAPQLTEAERAEQNRASTSGTQPTPQPPPAIPSPPASVARQTLDLLALVDVAKDGVTGDWSRRADGVAVMASRAARLQLPYVPPQEYDFILDFTVTKGSPDVAQILCAGGNDFVWKMGAANDGNEPPHPDWFGFEMVDGQFFRTNKTKTITPWKLENGMRHSAVLTVRKDGVTATVNGRELVQLKTDFKNVGIQRAFRLNDPRLLGFGAWDCDVNFHRAEVREVSGKGTLTRTAPSVASATKAAPFVNSLGMKFVPVPGTKVLFSIWDTRVRDYAAYAEKNKVNDAWKTMEKPGFPVSRDPEYPVVCVSWDDAQAFCRWLTAQDSAAGLVPRGAKYRLPTDAEWSMAVGLPPETGATPAEKGGKNTADFPWGQEFPPKTRVGNYADETYHAMIQSSNLVKDDKSAIEWIQGFSDGYATTSPVGSYPSNKHGLYDMGGNVSQWCEDWFDASQKTRTLRGTSWMTANRETMLSSFRYQRPSSYIYIFYGFRCVLEPAPSAAATPGTASALSSAKQTLDLLALADPVKDTMMAEGMAGANKWSKAGGRLSFSADAKSGKIGAPVSLNGLRDYEVEVEVTQTQDVAITLDFPTSAKSQATLDFRIGNDITLASDENRQRKVISKWPANVKLPCRFAGRVKFDADGENGTITVSINGAVAGSWHGPLTKLGKPSEMHPDFAGQLLPAIFVVRGDRTYSAWTLRVFEGEAKVLRGAAAPAK